MLKFISTTLLSLTLATTVHADEAWDTPIGEIIYQSEEYGAAIFSFTNFDGFPAELVIPGLAGNYDQRGVHPVYYIGEGEFECDAALSRPGGQASLNWGRGYISFDERSFPTSFTLLLGTCFDAPTDAIRAEAR
ncbi:hypothetical protein [Alterinioella nitratireducens]|uniref:hypothetical protein n=1 Tax=Alterinioella nitratireducens TaxID=2735915 RepID=UPI004058D203